MNLLIGGALKSVTNMVQLSTSKMEYDTFVMDAESLQKNQSEMPSLGLRGKKTLYQGLSYLVTFDTSSIMNDLELNLI